MWLFVVAAGSGYLARCLQNASSSTKKPRLLDNHDDDHGNQANHMVVDDPLERSSRSPPQEASPPSVLISEEALKFKERFEKLGTADGTLPWYGDRDTEVPDEGNPVVLSYQKGSYHGPSKFKNRTKGSTAWPRALRGRSQLGKKKMSRGVSPDAFDLEVDEFLKHQVPAEDEREVHVDDPFASPEKLFNAPVFRRKGGVLQAEEESLGGLFDWASMASSQEPLVFGELSKPSCSSGTRSRRRYSSRGRINSASSSTSSTPAPFLPPMDILKKRKSVESSQVSRVSPRELLLFAAGLHTGISCMLLYHKKEMEKITKMDEGSETSFAKPGLFCEAGDDNESVVTVEDAEPDQMAVLEAELEAELELMEFNMRARKVLEAGSGSTGYCSPRALILEGNTSNSNENWTISPRDLDRRLHLLLQERQEKRIQELEAELEEAEMKLNKKDEELLSWKLKVNRLKALSLATAADDAAEVEKPQSRKRWFSEETELEEPRYEVAFPETPNRWEGRAMGNGAINPSSSSSADNGSVEELQERMENLSIVKADTRHSFRDFLENARVANSASTFGDESRDREGPFPPTMGRRFSTSETVEVTRSFIQDGDEATVATSERLIYVNTKPRSRGDRFCQQSQVIRTVETAGRRHSTGSAFRSMNGNHSGCPRQRKRWFS